MFWFRKISILYRAPLPSKMYSLKLVDIKLKQAKPPSLLFKQGSVGAIAVVCIKKPMDCVPWVFCFSMMRVKKKYTHPPQPNLGRCPRLVEFALSGHQLAGVIKTRMREGVLFKLEVQSLKLQMERLQWGFPIAIALSLNKPPQINEK